MWSLFSSAASAAGVGCERGALPYEARVNGWGQRHDRLDAEPQPAAAAHPGFDWSTAVASLLRTDGRRLLAALSPSPPPPLSPPRPPPVPPPPPSPPSPPPPPPVPPPTAVPAGFSAIVTASLSLTGVLSFGSNDSVALLSVVAKSLTLPSSSFALVAATPTFAPAASPAPARRLLAPPPQQTGTLVTFSVACPDAGTAERTSSNLASLGSPAFVGALLFVGIPNLTAASAISIVSVVAVRPPPSPPPPAEPPPPAASASPAPQPSSSWSLGAAGVLPIGLGAGLGGCAVVVACVGAMKMGHSDRAAKRAGESAAKAAEAATAEAAAVAGMSSGMSSGVSSRALLRAKSSQRGDDDGDDGDDGKPSTSSPPSRHWSLPPLPMGEGHVAVAPGRRGTVPNTRAPIGATKSVSFNGLYDRAEDEGAPARSRAANRPAASASAAASPNRAHLLLSLAGSSLDGASMRSRVGASGGDGGGPAGEGARRRAASSSPPRRRRRDLAAADAVPTQVDAAAMRGGGGRRSSVAAAATDEKDEEEEEGVRRRARPVAPQPTPPRRTSAAMLPPGRRASLASMLASAAVDGFDLADVEAGLADDFALPRRVSRV